MYGRHRSPGNGYRGGGAGGGIGVTPIRSFNPDYRNFNRGFGRGGGGHPSPRPFQVSSPIPPTPHSPSVQNHHHHEQQQQQHLRHPSPSPSPSIRKADLFIEAGRLAAKYLVSQGLLPSDSLANGSMSSLKNDNIDYSHDSDGNSSRRTSPGDYGSLRNYARDGRSVSRENGAVSFTQSDKAAEVNDNITSADSDLKEVNSEICKSSNDVSTPASASANEEPHIHQASGPGETTDKNNSSSSNGNNDGETGACAVEHKMKNQDNGMNSGHWETIVGANSRAMEKDASPVQEGFTIQPSEEAAKMPTEMISGESVHSELGHTYSQLSVTDMVAKTDTLSVPEGSNAGDAGDKSVSSVSAHDHESPASITMSNRILGSEFSDFQNSRAGLSLSAGNLGGQALFVADQEKPGQHQSSNQNKLMYEQRPSEVLPDLQRSSSTQERGVKRVLEDGYMSEGAKKTRHWLSFGPMEDHSHFSEPIEKCSNSQIVGPSDSQNVGDAPNHDNSIGAFLFPRSDGLPPMEFKEEKQFFPGSFRISDLNLMESSDMNANNRNLTTSTSAGNKEAPVDVDLSMSNSCTPPNGYGSVASGKDVGVIDLEDSSFPGDGGDNMKTEAELAEMDHLPNHGQNPDDTADAQDGYGLMISELIGIDIPNCPTVQPGIQSMGNEVGLPPGEVILNEDDPIYMSLGEIPLSILRMWEQPTQDYD